MTIWRAGNVMKVCTGHRSDVVVHTVFVLPEQDSLDLTGKPMAARLGCVSSLSTTLLENHEGGFLPRHDRPVFRFPLLTAVFLHGIVTAQATGLVDILCCFRRFEPWDRQDRWQVRQVAELFFHDFLLDLSLKPSHPPSFQRGNTIQYPPHHSRFLPVFKIV